jgi:hypothetical protein
MVQKSKAGRSAGRPPTGVRAGEKASEYPRVTMRLPADALDLMRAIGGVVHEPAWRVVVAALEAYAGSRPPLSLDARKAVVAVRRVHRSA